MAEQYPRGIQTIRREDEDEALPLSANGHGARPVVASGVSVDAFDAGERHFRAKVKIHDPKRGGVRIVYLQVTYDPGKITEELTGYVRDLIDDGDNAALSQTICEVLSDWDLVGPLRAWRTQTNEMGGLIYGENGRPIREQFEIVAAGEPVPLDPAIVQHLRLSILTGLWRAVQEDQFGSDDPNARKR